MTKNTEDKAVEAIAGIIVRDVLQEEYDDLVEGYLDEILTASRRIMQLPAYAAVGKLFEKRLDDAITSRDARIEKLEAALGKARVGINASYAMAQAEYQNHDRIAERHDCTVQDALEAIRQALTGEA